MEDELPQGAEGAEGADDLNQQEGSEPSPVPGQIPPLPPELSTREQELRALIDAGASSPEELRELAAKLKAQRTYEESLWERDVRPALMQAKKKRPSIVDLRRDGLEGERSSLGLGVALLVGALVLVLIATQTSFLLLLVGAVGVLVYAWVHGLRSSGEGTREPPESDATG